jgi:hypothetical protein
MLTQFISRTRHTPDHMLHEDVKGHVLRKFSLILSTWDTIYRSHQLLYDISFHHSDKTVFSRHFFTRENSAMCLLPTGILNIL